MALGAKKTLVKKIEILPVVLPRAYSETHYSNNHIEVDSSALKEKKSVL